MNDYLSHSSKLINIQQLVESINQSLTELCRKRIKQNVSALEETWHKLGEKISENENAMKKLKRAACDILELISDCNLKLNGLEAELKVINVDQVETVFGFETSQKQLSVSTILKIL